MNYLIMKVKAFRLTKFMHLINVLLPEKVFNVIFIIYNINFLIESEIVLEKTNFLEDENNSVLAEIGFEKDSQKNFKLMPFLKNQNNSSDIFLIVRSIKNKFGESNVKKKQYKICNLKKIV